MDAYFEEADWADVGSMTDFERVNDEILGRYLEQGRQPQQAKD